MYVADRFREIGLEPLGDDGTFFQHFTMPIVDLTEMSTLTGSGGKTYQPRVDFTESVGGRSGSGTAEAEIAAIGGAARTGGLNDFAGANVRGKIALVTGPAAPNGGSSVENAYQEGAIGVLLVGGATLRYSYIPRLQSETIPTFVISEDVANQLLAPSGKTLTTAQALVRAHRADASALPSGFDVQTTIRMSVSLTPIHDVDAINVVGVLRAPDPNNAARAVLVGGHLDGVRTDPNGAGFQRKRPDELHTAPGSRRPHRHTGLHPPRLCGQTVGGGGEPFEESGRRRHSGREGPRDGALGPGP